MEVIPHDRLVVTGVLKALAKESEPFTAATYYDPSQPFIPYSQVRRGRFNVQGKILHILGVKPEQIAILTPAEVTATIADGLLASTTLQRGFLPHFDSHRFGLNRRTGREVVRILHDTRLALGDRAGEIAHLAEVIAGYSDQTSSRIEPATGPEGMLYATNTYATKLQMAGVAYFQAPPVYSKEKDIRQMANFTAQAVIRNVAVDLPAHIADIAVWAANELQIAGDDGKISATVKDPIQGITEIRSELHFLPRLVDPEGNPLTIEYLRDYTLKGWEKPTRPTAIKRDTKRIMDLVREKRRQLHEAEETQQSSQS